MRRKQLLFKGVNLKQVDGGGPNTRFGRQEKRSKDIQVKGQFFVERQADQRKTEGKRSQACVIRETGRDSTFQTTVPWVRGRGLLRSSREPSRNSKGPENVEKEWDPGTFEEIGGLLKKTIEGGGKLDITTQGGI